MGSAERSPMKSFMDLSVLIRGAELMSNGVVGDITIVVVTGQITVVVVSTGIQNFE